MRVVVVRMWSLARRRAGCLRVLPLLPHGRVQPRGARAIQTRADGLFLHHVSGGMHRDSAIATLGLMYSMSRSGSIRS